MPILSATSTKGGASKTTQLMIIINWLLYNTNENINVIDCDEKDDLSAWIESLTETEKSRINLMQAYNPAQFVEKMRPIDPNEFTLIDLEGSANELVTMALRQSHLILIPMTPSASDAKQGFKTLNNIKLQEDPMLNEGKLRKRHRAFTFSRTNAMVKTKAQKSIEKEIEECGEILIPVAVPETTAIEAMGGYGSTLQNLPTSSKDDPTPQQVETAIRHTNLFVEAVLKVLNETRG